MSRCTNILFTVLLILWSIQNILGITVGFEEDVSRCVGNNVTLTCKIDPFTTPPSATWSRNGSIALTTCTSFGSCTVDFVDINGIRYSFTGSVNGIHVSFQINPEEGDIQWSCGYNAVPYPYLFSISNNCPGNNEEGFPTWAIIVIIIVILALLGSPIVILLILRIRKKRKEKTGSLEHVYAEKDSQTEFGQTISNEDTTADVVWKKNGKLVISYHSERTKFKILRVSTEDEGIYSCTFGSNSMQLRYSLIVFGTEEIVYVQIGSKKDFGRTIPDEIATAYAMWKKDGKNVTSTHSERTKFKIVKASSEDEGLYVCTFGKNKMQLTFSLIVVDEIIYVQNGDRIELGKDIQDEHIFHSQWTHNGKMVTSHEIDGTKIQIQNASKSDAGLYVCTFEPNTMQLKYQLIVDGSQSKKSKSNLPGGRLTPVENTTYKGRSTLDHKPYGEPLPPLTRIPSNQAKKDE